MAIVKIQMIPPGYTDIVHPETDGSMVLMADSTTVEAKIAAHLADYVRQPAFGSATGAVNAYTFSAMPATTLVDGMSVYLDNVIAANTGASTFNWSGLGANAIVDSKGNALIAGKMPLNCLVGLRYNASILSFQLLGEGSDTLTGNMVAADLLSGKTGYSNDPLTKITGTATIATLGGKGYAEGTLYSLTAGSNFTVTGLPFTPRTVISNTEGTILSSIINSTTTYRPVLATSHTGSSLGAGTFTMYNFASVAISWKAWE